MKNNEFKALYNIIINNNDDQNPIFGAGFLWINLTKSQGEKITKVLVSQGYPHDDKFVYLPSGLGLSIQEWR